MPIIFAVAFAIPAFAEAPDLKPIDEVLKDGKSAPQKSPYAGWQFGIGAPLALWPLSSVNWFVGYANKDAPGFWGKRFGFRADLATGTNKMISARVYDETSIDFNLNVLGLKYNYKWEDAFDPIAIHGADVNLDGVNGVFSVNDNRFGGLIDFYPFGDTAVVGGFRLSGGYYIGRLDIDLRANVPNDTPPGGFIIDVGAAGEIRTRLQGGAQVRGKLNWKYNGPYGGLGWDIGVFRGFKFFVDAGVIFTNPPKLHDSDIVLPYDKIQACYVIGNGFECGWTNIDKNDIPGTTAGLLGSILDEILTAPGGNFNGTDVSLFQNILIAGNIDPTVILNDITSWVIGGGAPPIWYSAGIAACGGNCDAINNIVQDAVANAHSALDSDVQGIIDEYHRGRHNIVRDANNILKDFQFYPIVRLGVMYRF